MLASGFLPPSHLCLLLQQGSSSPHRVCSGHHRNQSQVVPHTAVRGRTLARWRRAKTLAAPRTACVLRPGHSASTPPRRSLRSGARPDGRVRVGSPVCSLLEVAVTAALAALTPLGKRTKRLLPAPRGWSSHPNPGLAQGKVQPPVALRRARDQLPVRLPRPCLWEAENRHRSSESRQSKFQGPFDTDLWRDSAERREVYPFLSCATRCHAAVCKLL
ncbi:hypothetical protein HispidOSU_027723 [Sigmodon hispidus]